MRRGLHIYRRENIRRIDMGNVKIRFLGTCACDFSPKLENEFKYCFDKDARRSSSMLINDNILVDCGIHTLESLDIAKIPYEQITDILITHTHDDHFIPKSIEEIAKSRHSPLRLWVREDADIPEFANVEIIRMKLITKYEQYGITVTGLPANHDPITYPQHLLVELNEKKLYYACDGGWIMCEALNYLRDANLDALVIDATMGDCVGDYRVGEHNSIPMIRHMLPSLKTNNIINENTKVYLSHIAPSLHKPHDETVEIARAFGADVAYDGLSTEV